MEQVNKLEIDPTHLEALLDAIINGAAFQSFFERLRSVKPDASPEMAIALLADESLVLWSQLRPGWHLIRLVVDSETLAGITATAEITRNPASEVVRNALRPGIVAAANEVELLEQDTDTTQ